MITGRAVGWGSKLPRRFSTFARIVALATLMMGVGSVPSEATSINHFFDQDTLVHDYNFVPFTPIAGGDTFYLYTFRVGFQAISTPFNLTITDNLIAFEGPNVDDFLGSGFKCAKITPVPGGECVDFVASSPDVGGLPQQEGQFTGPITVAIRYTPYGWPLYGDDPIDIGLTDNFSSFMLYASQAPDPVFPELDDTYRLVHFSTNASDPDAKLLPITTIAHCGGSDIDACARANDLDYFVVPEPATLGGVVWGLLGLTVLSRRLKRRD